MPLKAMHRTSDRLYTTDEHAVILVDRVTDDEMLVILSAYSADAGNHYDIVEACDALRHVINTVRLNASRDIRNGDR